MSATMAASLLFLAGPLARPVKPFSDLTEADSVVVAWRAWNCFQPHAYAFRFRRESGRFLVTAYDCGDVTHPEPWRRGQTLGTVELTLNDLRRLDNTFAYYRKRIHVRSTAEDDVRIEQFRGGEWIAGERFIDGSQATTHSEEVAKILKQPYLDALSLDALLKRTKAWPSSG